jgi:Ser/Thr protein kinase RdoA (MazF antagonist)
MAAIQARMHLVGQDYAGQYNISPILHQLAETHVTAALLSDPKTDPPLRPLLRRAQAFTVQLDQSLPIGLSHFDYDADNLFTDNAGHVTAVLDFDDTQCLPLVVCLAYTLWDIIASTNNPDELVTRYLQIYQQTRPLTQAEKDILPAIILFRHHVITALDIHFGDFSQADIDNALDQESKIIHLALRF